MKQLPWLSGLLKRSNQGHYSIDARELSPALPNKTFAKTFFKEFSLVRSEFDPYSIWKTSPFQGETINVDSFGRRLTCFNRSVSSNKKPLKIAVFGGSTLFGTGADDCHTIPSYLAKELSDHCDDCAFMVSNYGTSGHQSNQGLMRLIALLHTGQRPDLVIFLDGVNDVYGGVYSPGEAGKPLNFDSIYQRYNDFGLGVFIKQTHTYGMIQYLRSRLKRNRLHAPSASMEGTVARMVALYRANIEILHALSNQFSFKYRAYWQPVLLSSSKPLGDFEREIIENSGALNAIYRQSYRAIRETDFSPFQFENMDSLFDQVQEDIFIDFCHTAQRGNEIMAEEIFRTIRPLIPINPRRIAEVTAKKFPETRN